jgi:hypothetical protein
MTDEELTRRFDRIDEKFKGVDEKFKGIDQQLVTLATKSDVQEEGAATRRHFDIVAEKLRADIALIAEGHKATTDNMAALSVRVDALEVRQESLDVRQLALETRQTKLE